MVPLTFNHPFRHKNLSLRGFSLVRNILLKDGRKTLPWGVCSSGPLFLKMCVIEILGILCLELEFYFFFNHHLRYPEVLYRCLALINALRIIMNHNFLQFVNILNLIWWSSVIDFVHSFHRCAVYFKMCVTNAISFYKRQENYYDLSLMAFSESI